MSAAGRDAHVECPHCGARFRRGRLACPECGSDERTGWQDAEEIDYASVEIPDAWPAPDSARRGPPLWWLIALLLALVVAVLLVLG